MTARNAPCPCGSGKKFKFCHGANSSPPAQPAMPENSLLKQALMALRSGQTESALAWAARLPDSVDKFRIQVNCLIRQRNAQSLQQALAQIRKWRRLQPEAQEPVQRELEIYLNQGQLKLAGKTLTEWPFKPVPAELTYFMAILHQLRGESDEALSSYAVAIQQQRAAAGSPSLGQSTLKVAAAIQMVETAAGNYPGAPGRSEDGMFGSAKALKQLQKSLVQWEQDPASASDPMEIQRVHANAWYNLGCAALADFTADDRRIELFERAIKLDPKHMLAQFNRAFAHNYSFTADSGQIFEAHRRAGNWLAGTVAETPKPIIDPDTCPRRLRLGYLSSDFRQHSVAHFILPVLQHHDRSLFEIFVYHNYSREDGQTEIAKERAEHFRNVSRLSDEQLFRQIRDDRIDLLIELNGLTEGHRLAMLARKVTPVQMSWMGYPNTNGIPGMDFRIVDEITDPPGQSENFTTETLLRLRHPFLCYSPPSDLPAVTDPPSLRKGYITFGSFNSLPKLNPPLLEHWASILHAVPGSCLLIKNLGMDFETPRLNLQNYFAKLGIEADRIEFAGKTDSQRAHLEHYARVDISLDAFPYNGTTTSCESLLMGVPVLSMAGSEHRSRVGWSLLSALGLETMVASDQNSLINLAVSLAADPERLHRLRSQLREILMNSRLTDANGLTRHLEDKLENIWRKKLEIEGVT